MKNIKKIFIFIIIFSFFCTKNVVAQEQVNCSYIQENIEKYNTNKQTLSNLDCTDLNNYEVVNQCNDINMKNNLIVTELLKLKEKNSICASNQAEVENIIKENDKCGKIFDESFNKFVDVIMGIFYILGPILLLLFGSLDFAKATVSADERALKLANQRFVKRVTALILLFLSPVIVNTIIGINISDKYLSGNAYSCSFNYLVYNKKYDIKIDTSGRTNNNMSMQSYGTAGIKQGNYIIYSQGDPAWGSEILINSPSRSTLGSDGCALTAVSMQIVNSGVVDEKTFSPKVLNNYLKKNTNTGGLISWGAIGGFTNGKFIHADSKNTSGTMENRARQLKEFIQQGYFPVIRVKCVGPGSHYVAVFEVQGNEIIIGDPAGGKLTTLSSTTYNIKNTTEDCQVELYKLGN